LLAKILMISRLLGKIYDKLVQSLAYYRNVMHYSAYRGISTECDV